MTQQPYDKWIAERRAASPPARFTDQVMRQVAEMERQRRDNWWSHVVERIERSLAARWAVCAGALAVGCVPFVFLASVAKLVPF